MSEKLKSYPFCGAEVEMRDPYLKWEEYGIVHDCIIIHTCENGFAVSIYTKHGYKTADEAREAMAKVWNQRHTPEPRQLTLDELKQMDKQPVWIHWMNWLFHRANCWMIVNLEKSEGTMWDFSTYGKAWVAYDRPPGGDAHEG